MDEKKVLAHYPFDGDFGEPGDRTLSDKMVTARKETPCHICGEPTAKGTRIRVLSEVCEGDFMTYRFCQKCCEAMALSWEDDGDAIEARYHLAKNKVD